MMSQRKLGFSPTHQPIRVTLCHTCLKPMILKKICCYTRFHKTVKNAENQKLKNTNFRLEPDLCPSVFYDLMQDLNYELQVISTIINVIEWIFRIRIHVDYGHKWTVDIH